jgi:uncharacterized protein
VSAVFHRGEVELQRVAGSAERLGRLGPQIMRSQMPEQHREFFPLLPFIIIGSIDRRGQPAASLLAGVPGFVSSPDARTLRVTAPVPPGDPLAQNLVPGAPLGVLGIQPHTRRRNRANGRVSHRDGTGFSVAIDQSFGNCPKYITSRELAYAGEPDAATSEAAVSSGLTPAERALMESADTFFIASGHPDAVRLDPASHYAVGHDDDDPAGGTPIPAHGLDVSHRGGPPGFVSFIDDATFIIPDLRGNDFYNTLGNLRLAPRAGLLFIDFQRGDLLSLETTAEALPGLHPLQHPAATGRIVRFHIERARLLPAAARLRVVPATE